MCAYKTYQLLKKTIYRHTAKIGQTMPVSMKGIRTYEYHQSATP